MRLKNRILCLINYNIYENNSLYPCITCRSSPFTWASSKICVSEELTMPSKTRQTHCWHSIECFGTSCSPGTVDLEQYQRNKLLNKHQEPTYSLILWLLLGSRYNQCSLWQNQNIKKRRMARYLAFSPRCYLMRYLWLRMPWRMGSKCIWVYSSKQYYWWDLCHLQSSRPWQRSWMFSNS